MPTAEAIVEKSTTTTPMVLSKEISEENAIDIDVESVDKVVSRFNDLIAAFIGASLNADV